MVRSWTDWLESLRLRLRNDWDVCVAVVGYNGVGKSTIAYRLAKDLDPTWDGSRMCMDEDDVWAALDTVRRGEAVVVDEGVEVLYARDSMTTTNKEVVRWLDVCRARGAILIICMSTLRALDSRVRDDRALWTLAVMSRGRAVLHERVGGDPMALDAAEGAGTWVRRLKVKYGAVSGPRWEGYQKRKDDRVLNYDPSERRTRRRRRRSDSDGKADDDAAPTRRRRRRVRD